MSTTTPKNTRTRRLRSRGRVVLLAFAGAGALGILIVLSCFVVPGSFRQMTPTAQQWPTLLAPLGITLDGPVSGRAGYVHGAGDTSIWIHATCESTAPEDLHDRLIAARFSESPSSGAGWVSPQMLGDWSRAAPSPDNREYFGRDGCRVLVRPRPDARGTELYASYWADNSLLLSKQIAVLNGTE